MPSAGARAQWQMLWLAFDAATCSTHRAAAAAPQPPSPSPPTSLSQLLHSLRWVRCSSGGGCDGVEQLGPSQPAAHTQGG
jgi:hypothetical protein